MHFRTLDPTGCLTLCCDQAGGYTVDDFSIINGSKEIHSPPFPPNITGLGIVVSFVLIEAF